MKIAIITPVFPPYTGGIGNVAYHHARILSRRGHEVMVFTPDYGGKKENLENYGFTLCTVTPLFSFGNAAYIPSIQRKLKGFDIVYLHYPFFGGAQSVYSFKRKNRDVKLVMLYHMDAIGKGWKKVLFSLYKNIYLKKIVNIADEILVTSLDYAKHSLIRDVIISNPDKCKELPNGVDTKLFFPSSRSTQLLKMFGISDEKVILFVGGLDKAHYFKGLEYLFQAFASIQEKAILLIVGKGELVDVYRKKAEDLKIGEKVFFCTDVLYEKLPEYYNISDITVLPSIDSSEAFGMVLIEAMACAKPVIATNLPGVRTVVENSFNGILVKIKDSKDIADAIRTILTNDSLAKKMGEEGRKKALAVYDWNKIVDTLEKIFRDLL